ncbi:MAG: DUF6320 domain-containing protein [Bacillota bacterium]|nr:DUF6320 domain-containing protein [Bacillota bacterium]
MRYCNKCNVSVRGDLKRCPLCQTPLSGIDEEGYCYPKILTVYSQYRTFFKILTFATIVAAVACGAVNLILPHTGSWSLLVIVCLACFWGSMYLAVRQRKSLPKNITQQALFVSIFCVIIDLLTNWHGWSLSYALPSIFVVAMISMTVLARVMNIPAEEYLFCLILDIVFGFIPIIFYALNMLNQNIPSVICMSCSVICLAGIALFQGREIIHELAKRFHL